MSDTVYLIDGSGYIFRAFYAITHLTNKEGFPTNALYGFTKMLIKLLRDAGSPNIAMVFDSGRKTFRNDLYSDYKANRTECPEDLQKQMPYFREISRAMGLPVLEQPGYEADDIIGTLTKRLSAAGHKVVVVSADKDLLQLVGDSVVVWDTMKDKKYRRDEVIEKFGVPPEQVVEILALIGDDSDNIPGLHGVGPKTATQLIQRFGTAERVLSAAPEIEQLSEIRNRKKIAESVVANSDIVRLSRRLVEIECNAPVSFTSDATKVDLVSLQDSDLIKHLSISSPDSQLLNSLVDRFEFTSIMGEFRPPSNTLNSQEFDYRSVSCDDIDGLFAMLMAAPEIAFDVETSSLSPREGRLVGFSFCFKSDSAYYVPYEGLVRESPELCIKIKTHLASLFKRQDLTIVGQNLKFDLQVLYNLGIEVKAQVWDTMIASYLVNPDRGSHNLTVLAREYLGRSLIEFEDIVPSGEDFSVVELDVATKYCCQDSHCAWLIREKLIPILKERGVDGVFNTIELPLVPVLAKIEFRGLKIDCDLLGRLSSEFAEDLAKLEVEIYELAGGRFNINSPKQLGQILFEKLALPTKGLKKTKSGISTDSGVLEKLSAIHPLPSKILDYRSIHKLKSTYVDALPAQVCPISGRLHTRLNQAITSTGRLSSSDPNLQNIPVQTAQGRRIRESFIADNSRGKILISADYSQIELRVLAHLSGDKNLINAFHSGIDIHAKTAREILGLSEDAPITSEMRRVGKTINFGVVYGMGPFRLARDLEIPINVANNYIEGYFSRYPGVRDYFAKLESDSDSLGYVSTLFGRKRWLAHIDSSGRDQGFVKRAALNAPIQGTAADLMKLAMIAVENRFQLDGQRIQMVLQIHDELLFEADSSFADEAVETIKQIMEGIVELAVPLVVDVGTGPNWQAAHS